MYSKIGFVVIELLVTEMQRLFSHVYKIRTTNKGTRCQSTDFDDQFVVVNVVFEKIFYSFSLSAMVDVKGVKTTLKSGEPEHVRTHVRILNTPIYYHK